MPRSIENGERWVVTGAGRGIGRALALELARRGAGLELVARSASELAEAAEACRAAGAGNVEIHAVDLLPTEAADTLADAILAGGTVDGLVNNAGTGIFDDAVDQTSAQLTDQIDLNILALMRLCHRIGPGMVERGRGSILNVASCAAMQAIPKQSVYAATKTWVWHFTTALHHELKSKGIHVTSLCPGLTKTAFFEKNRYETSARGFRLGTWSSPEEVARVGIHGVLRNKVVAIPGLVNKLSAIAVRRLPRTFVARTVRWLLS